MPDSSYPFNSKLCSNSHSNSLMFSNKLHSSSRSVSVSKLHQLWPMLPYEPQLNYLPTCMAQVLRCKVDVQKWPSNQQHCHLSLP